MNKADNLDYHLAQIATLGISPSQYLALYPEVDGELRVMLLLGGQLRSVAQPCPPLSDEMRQRMLQRLTAPPPPALPAPAHIQSPFFIPGFNHLEAIRYIGARGLGFLWRIHKAPGAGYVAMFDLVVLLMRALRRLEMYNSLR